MTHSVETTHLPRVSFQPRAVAARWSKERGAPEAKAGESTERRSGHGHFPGGLLGTAQAGACLPTWLVSAIGANAHVLLQTGQHRSTLGDESAASVTHAHAKSQGTAESAKRNC